MAMTIDIGVTVFLKTSKLPGINIALGTVVAKDNSQLLNGKPIPKECIIISIEEVLAKDAQLPYPEPPIICMGDAKGTSVIWPINDVVCNIYISSLLFLLLSKIILG